MVKGGGSRRDRPLMGRFWVPAAEPVNWTKCDDCGGPLHLFDASCRSCGPFPEGGGSRRDKPMFEAKRWL